MSAKSEDGAPSDADPAGAKILSDAAGDAGEDIAGFIGRMSEIQAEMLAAQMAHQRDMVTVVADAVSSILDGAPLAKRGSG